MIYGLYYFVCMLGRKILIFKDTYTVHVCTVHVHNYNYCITLCALYMYMYIVQVHVYLQNYMYLHLVHVPILVALLARVALSCFACESCFLVLYFKCFMHGCALNGIICIQNTDITFLYYNLYKLL